MDDRRTLGREDLEALHERLERGLYNVAYRLLWNPADAREVVQEAFLRLWRMRSRVELATVEPLLYKIVMNLAANRRRARRTWRWVTLEPLRERAGRESDPHELTARDERERALREAVDALPERLRRPLVLCDLSDMTYEQVGRALGIPAGTVGSRRHAALKALRRRLARFDERASTGQGARDGRS